MKPMTHEWVAKAEGDFAMVERESQARKDPSYDGICFHSQQCAEKYLKARLCEAGIDYPKMHDLVALLEMALDVEPDWETHREDLAFLTDMANNIRYPSYTASEAEAQAAEQQCRRFRDAARAVLPLES
jgi:HEPN domain-containing protein